VYYSAAIHNNDPHRGCEDVKASSQQVQSSSVCLPGGQKDVRDNTIPHNIVYAGTTATAGLFLGLCCIVCGAEAIRPQEELGTARLVDVAAAGFYQGG
jgi:hypothetical protein